MVKLTASLTQWLFKVGKQEIIPLLSFGHIELFTEEMQKDYLEWLRTEEGQKALERGAENGCEQGNAETTGTEPDTGVERTG